MKSLLITLLLSSTLFADTYKCGTDTVKVEVDKITITDSEGVTTLYENVYYNLYVYGELELMWYGDKYMLRSHTDEPRSKKVVIKCERVD